MLGYFGISINHRTPTWTTGSLTCVCVPFCMCLHKGVCVCVCVGGGGGQASSPLSLDAHNHVDDYSGTLGGVHKVHISALVTSPKN